VFFFKLHKLIYYLPTYYFKNNNPKIDFNLGIELNKSNGPLSISRIVNHFVSHATSQNDKVQFDCLVTLDMAKMTCPY